MSNGYNYAIRSDAFQHHLGNVPSSSLVGCATKNTGAYLCIVVTAPVFHLNLNFFSYIFAVFIVLLFFFLFFSF